MERWLGFVFHTLKELQPDTVEIRTFPDGQAGLGQPWNATLTLRDMNLFEASARALELAGLVTLAQSVPLKKQSMPNESTRPPRLKLPSTWHWAIGGVVPDGDQAVLQGADDPFARDEMATLAKLTSALLSPARTLADATTPLSARHALVMFRPAVDDLAGYLTRHFGNHDEADQGQVIPPCNYPMEWQTCIMKLAEAVRHLPRRLVRD